MQRLACAVGSIVWMSKVIFIFILKKVYNE